MEGILPMSNEEQELYIEIIVDAYQKGTTKSDISLEGLFNEIKQRLVQVMEKNIVVQKEV
jgi:hypothetical protein